mmetsp:Transcript_43865/g.131015  ORF Transcript_43865/g.131015 Transcript_43865/m.131015 type:complete len:355 (-) Transcript_43865:464-1528(-)
MSSLASSTPWPRRDCEGSSCKRTDISTLVLLLVVSVSSSIAACTAAAAAARSAETSAMDRRSLSNSGCNSGARHTAQAWRCSRCVICCSMNPSWTFRASTASISRSRSESPLPSTSASRSRNPSVFSRLPRASRHAFCLSSSSRARVRQSAPRRAGSDWGPVPMSWRSFTSATAMATLVGTTCAPLISTEVARLALTITTTSSRSHSYSAGARNTSSRSPSLPSQHPADFSSNSLPGNFFSPSVAAVHVRTSSTGGPLLSKSSEQRKLLIGLETVVCGLGRSSSESVVSMPDSSSSKLRALMPPEVALEVSRSSGSAAAGASTSSSCSSGGCCQATRLRPSAESALDCSLLSSR